jgi:hypothetical protein
MLVFLKNVFILAQNDVFHFKMISFEDISFQTKISNFLFQTSLSLLFYIFVLYEAKHNIE